MLTKVDHSDDIGIATCTEDEIDHQVAEMASRIEPVGETDQEIAGTDIPNVNDLLIGDGAEVGIETGEMILMTGL